MQYEPHCNIYNCNTCSKEDQKERGCKSKKKQVVQVFPCLCKGLNGKCKTCKGSGKITVKECPIKLVNKSTVSFLLPYFYFWKHTRRFPDDSAIIEQPIKMREAFNILNTVSCEREQAAIESARNNK